MTERNQQNSLLGKIAAYTEILSKDPTSTIFVSLSEAYRKMGMLGDARQVIERGLETNADFSPAHIVYARILCQQGEYDESETAFRKALENDPENLAALVGSARLFILLGQEDKARPLLLDARELSPADPVINKLLLSLPEIIEEEKVNDTKPDLEEQIDTSVVTDEEIESSESPPLASSTLADLYLQQGLTEQALDMYRQLSIENPDNLLFRRKIRDIEEELTGSSTEVLEEPIGLTPEPVQSPDDVGSFSDDTNSFNPEQVETIVLEEPVEVEQQAADEKVLQKLNRWLDSIKKRREDV